MALKLTRNALKYRLIPPFCSSKRFYSSPAIDAESTAGYCTGGYHPVKAGDVFNHGKYKVLTKLGYGVYSTVWLAYDVQWRQHVALKILTADSHSQGRDIFEIDHLKCIRSATASDPTGLNILQLLDSFQHQGPNGTHACLVFPAMGPDMNHYRQFFPNGCIPSSILKNISRQLLLALSFLHDACHVIHTDIKPGNILIDTPSIRDMFQYAPPEVFMPESEDCREPVVEATPAAEATPVEATPVASGEENLAQTTSVSAKIADFGTASRFDKHLTEWIQPDRLRAPEVILGAKWDYKVDIWSLGLVIWEFAEGPVFFDGRWTAKSEYSSDAHLAEMIALLGKMPETLLGRSENRHRYFDNDGNLFREAIFPPRSLEKFSEAQSTDSLEKKNFMNFIRSMIKLDPEERLSAKQLLASPWLSASPDDNTIADA